MIRPAAPNETATLVAVAAATGIFQPSEAEQLLGGVLQDFHAGRLDTSHQVQVFADDETGAVDGWVYFAPCFKADGVWDLWWIGVSPTAQGKGVGGALLEFVEGSVRGMGARLLIIETSSTEPLAKARNFYAKRGYANCGQIPDFYGDGDDKIIFAKRLAA
jgi:ribosomal protein S18 acetylase RimI-like enzyme